MPRPTKIEAFEKVRIVEEYLANKSRIVYHPNFNAKIREIWQL